MIPKFACFWDARLWPVGAQPQKVFPYEYSQEDLPNGLRLITIPTDYPNIVAIYIVVQTGSRNEVEPGNTGFAHLFEHLMFRGTAKYPPEKYNQTLQRASAPPPTPSPATISPPITPRFPRKIWTTVLAMEADRFQHLKYSRDRLQDRNAGGAGRVQQEQRQPVQQAGRSAARHGFDRHTYKHTTMGFLKDVQDMPNQYEYSLQVLRPLLPAGVHHHHGGGRCEAEGRARAGGQVLGRVEARQL